MPDITWWNRLEPRPRVDDITDPLRARIRDPLWMLTRQWQLGEFQGLDSGSPAWVQLTERVGAITSWQAQDAAPIALGAMPLEKAVESETFTSDLGTAIELGQILSRLLAKSGSPVAPFLTRFPISDLPAPATADPADLSDAQLRRTCAGRTVDGIAAYAAIKANDPTVPTAPAATLQAFVAWVEQTFGPLGNPTDAKAWQPPRLEYAATASATYGAGIAALNLTPGDDGLIDWTAFDVASTTKNATIPPVIRTVIPAHVRFKGMPNARFWDFENGTLDFGDLKPDKRDLARLALIDFMLVQANDWFMLPVEMPVGGTYQLDSLIVHDVFGIDTLIERADREVLGPGTWTMFSTSTADGKATADFFLLPPTAGAALQTSHVLEEIRFARDEMANMVWAIENVLENAAGDPWPQHERDIAQGVTPGAAVPPDGELSYQIESNVPSYWIPFLPVTLAPAEGSVVLELAQAIDPATQNPILPRGRILQPTAIAGGAPYQIPEEEVPRNGVEVQRLVARCRWSDGSTHLWQLRRIQPGTGETSSALRFDQANPVAPAT